MTVIVILSEAPRPSLGGKKLADLVARLTESGSAEGRSPFTGGLGVSPSLNNPAGRVGRKAYFGIP